MKQKIDVLFINPGLLGVVYQELGHDFSAIEPPTIAALFATYVRQKGGTVGIIDAPALGLTPPETAEYLCDQYDPTLIVMVVYGYQPSASTQNMTSASETCREIKKLNPDYKILMTGTHIAALPKKTLEEEQIDFACSLEGPPTIWKLYQELKSGNNNFDLVPSLVYRDKNNATVFTQHASLIQNISEEMPGAAWDLLPMDKYRAHNWHCFEHIHERKPYAAIHTSMGCPYRCTFCCINAPFGKSSYRCWDPQVVMNEIDILVNQYGVKNIKIVDEMFVLNPKHVHGICDRLIERNYGLNIWAYARVDTVRDEFLEKLYKAGIRWLALGIESASKHVRDGMQKGRFDTDDILKVVKKIQDAGINVIGNYIFGLPDDTFDSMQKTLDLAIEANCEFANFYCAMAYPGSKLYNIAIQNKWDLPNSWIGYSQHSYHSHPLRTEYLTSAEILEFRDNAFEIYFKSPKYLQLIKDKFGDAVLEHIKHMTKIKLRRKIVEDATMTKKTHILLNENANVQCSQNNSVFFEKTTDTL